ncbi:MAG: NAD(P)H-binding protein, partial [bacterium]
MLTSTSSLPSVRILLTGATGYVGGRLLRRLEDLRADLRCLARRPEFLAERVAPTTQVVTGDLLNAKSLASAMEGVNIAYYLVHSMGATGDFEEQDRKAAQNFAAAAREAGVQRIIYLGGLGRDEKLSPHLASRHEV